MVIKALSNFYLANDLSNAEQQSLHTWAIYGKYWQSKDSVASLPLLYFTLLANQFLVRLLLDSRIYLTSNHRSFNQACDSFEANFYPFCEQKPCKLGCCNRNLLVFACRSIPIGYSPIWYTKYTLVSPSNVYQKRLGTALSSIRCLACLPNCSEFWRKPPKQLRGSNGAHQEEVHCFEMLSN